MARAPRVICPVCLRLTALRPDGTLYPHYADGAGHTCEWSGHKPERVKRRRKGAA